MLQGSPPAITRPARTVQRMPSRGAPGEKSVTSRAGVVRRSGSPDGFPWRTWRRGRTGLMPGMKDTGKKGDYSMRGSNCIFPTLPCMRVIRGSIPQMGQA
jgi:hypothetical protein